MANKTITTCKNVFKNGKKMDTLTYTRMWIDLINQLEKKDLKNKSNDRRNGKDIV